MRSAIDAAGQTADNGVTGSAKLCCQLFGDAPVPEPSDDPMDNWLNPRLPAIEGLTRVDLRLKENAA